MGFLDKVKEQAEQAAAKAKEGIDDVQAKRELKELYAELGQEAFTLHEQGALTHPALDGLAEKIRDVKARLEDEAPKPETVSTR